MATATKSRIATIKGTFAVPGVSKNRRWYKPEHIRAAVAEAQSLIDSGNAPTVFAMLTHHGARDASTGDVTRTAGRITGVGLSPEGNGTFEADIADTAAGRDIAALTTPDDPYLRTCSMASVWNGPIRTVMGPDGAPCETADGFSLRGIDWTHSPGIVGAEITSAELAEAADGGLMYESIEESVFVEHVDEQDQVTEAETFADPGYHGEKRFKISTPSDLRATWVHLHQTSVTESYTPKQIQRMRGKVKSAAQKAGIDIVEQTNLLGAEILEAYASVCLDNGPGDVRVSGWTDDPEQLAALGQRVAMAALAGLYQLDPDNDGDIDLEDDEQMESDPSHQQGEAAPNQKEGVVPEPKKNEGAADESTLSLTKAQLDEAIAAGIKAHEAAVAAPVTESAEVIAARALIAEADAAKVDPAKPADEATAPGTFTQEQVTALVTEAATKAAATATESIRSQVVEEIRANGPRRRGHVAKSILEQSPTELYGDEVGAIQKMDTAALEKVADDVMFPLMAS